MPTRATKRGDDRTPLDLDCDVLICGASFAGLTVARELAASPARPRVVVVDRYEIGERQTSACAVPRPWLELLGLTDAILQEFGEITAHTAKDAFTWALPEPFATFDYGLLCRLLAAQGDFTFETAKVEGRGPVASSPGAGRPGSADPALGTPLTVLTDRGPVRAPLVVDALGWRRVLAPASEDAIQPPEAYLSRGLEVHPEGTSDELALYLNPRYVPDGYSWSFPAGDEVRVGVGSFDPHHHVKDPTLRLVEDLEREPHGFQGNWIPHRLRPATGGDVFFVGDSAGHCLPLTAEGIRPAFHFGIALGRELRHVVEGRQTREQALRRYASTSAQKDPAYRWLLRLQRLVGGIVPHRRTLTAALRATTPAPVARRAWDAYLGALSASRWAGGPSTPSPSPGAHTEPSSAGATVEVAHASRPVGVPGD
ncbi:NAD(P)/FAD-dependent oxidoreductase [Patulibacter sp.]|uniref:NAD(P)/FAD-dependent oxidoreductase n=1 Tax=Patulibacter sp. TaxID=1912859 RepID=UPI002724678F|nr:NAD(P)/FAD-dependent oxidoreductase [Patulibacter sp.]MDO9409906.1 NAD(P)/FAD-dependent oxidoreductase [Patulibacter sp.]